MPVDRREHKLEYRIELKGTCGMLGDADITGFYDFSSITVAGLAA
jgi:hypothetical protein